LARIPDYVLASSTAILDALLPLLPSHAQRRLPQLASAYLTGRGDRLVIHSSDTRSQHANREACLDKLRALVQRSLKRPKVRRATKPSRGAKERRLKSKRQRGEIKANRRPPM